MIERDTIASEIKYCKDLIAARKTRNNIDSSDAILYRDTRTSGPVSQTYTLAAGQTRLTRVTYAHPGADTPYCQLQYRITDTEQSINYQDYREIPSSNLQITQWTFYLRNLGSSSDTFKVTFGVKSMAAGTLSLEVI